MPLAGFEPAIPLFERPTIVRALDGAAIGTGCRSYSFLISINVSKSLEKIRNFVMVTLVIMP